MATDIVIRSADGIMSLVTDEREMEIDGIFIDRAGRLSIVYQGVSKLIGHLVPSMLELAKKCHRAVFIMMAGNSVAECKNIDFVNLNSIGGR